MKGRGTESEWLETAEVLDLRAVGAAWESIPQPFARRALTVAVVGERVFVIGGFDADDTPRLDVDIYDAAARVWGKGPPIPGPEKNGFSPAACAVKGRVYLSVASGEMFRLSEDRATWEAYARTTPRIVHRLVASGQEIFVIGGASEARMMDLIESVPVR